MKTFFVLAAILAGGLLVGQKKPADDHHAALNSRGDHAMGFSHDRTAHHFRLLKDGGSIEVLSKDPKDIESRDQVRMHLKHIATSFAEGNFDMPMFIHDQVPPGVPAMKRLKSQIKYQVEAIPDGARVRITTANPEAIAAVHEFLKFQITDHQTGDPLEPER
jgi:hypothetical protein